jgi:hypothetical protein
MFLFYSYLSYKPKVPGESNIKAFNFVRYWCSILKSYEIKGAFIVIENCSISTHRKIVVYVTCKENTNKTQDL